MSESRDRPSSIKQFYLKGWKEVGAYTGYHYGYLQRLHLTELMMPFTRIGSNPKGKWIISPAKVDLWLKAMDREIKTPLELKRMREERRNYINTFLLKKNVSEK